MYVITRNRLLYSEISYSVEFVHLFLPRDAPQSAVIRLYVVCVSVCLSVRP